MAKWTIDSDHSVAAFSVRHMMIANVRGQFNRISGTIYFDPVKIDKSSLEVTVDASSILTGIQKRDEHLKSPDFFNVVKYPDITFKSIQIDHAKGDLVKVTGEMTLHGVTRQITVAATFIGPVKDPFGDDKSMGFSTSFIINLDDYGISWNQPMENNGLLIGREVLLFIDLEADMVSE